MNKLQKLTFIALAVIGVFFLVSFDKSNTKQNSPTRNEPYVQYLIVSADRTYSLEARIGNYLQDGWVLIGGVTVEGDKFYQAIAR